MNKLSKTIAAILGAATLATSPMSANAASFRTVPVLSLQDSVVIDVHRRRFRHRHSGRRRGRGGGVGAGIIGGIILGGIIAESSRSRHRRSRRRDDSHIDWCYDRYRSYRAYDNTFQPHRGRRRPCYSPYY